MTVIDIMIIRNIQNILIVVLYNFEQQDKIQAPLKLILWILDKCNKDLSIIKKLKIN